MNDKKTIADDNRQSTRQKKSVWVDEYKYLPTYMTYF